MTAQKVPYKISQGKVAVFAATCSHSGGLISFGRKKLLTKLSRRTSLSSYLLCIADV